MSEADITWLWGYGCLVLVAWLIFSENTSA